MSDLKKIVKGSKLAFAVSVGGLGDELTLQSDSVSCIATFFCQDEHRGYKVKPQLIILESDDPDSKENFFPDTNDENTYIAIVDTHNLDTGRLKVAVQVWYTDDELNKLLSPEVVVTSDVVITYPFNTLPE